MIRAAGVWKLEEKISDAAVKEEAFSGQEKLWGGRDSSGGEA